MLINKKQYDFFRLFDTFLKEMEDGTRKQKNGKPLRKSSIKPYIYLQKRLYDFSIKKNFPLHIYAVDSLKKRGLNAEKKYWVKFYNKFTDYLYKDCDCFDNYVNSSIKRLRAFFNYLIEDKDINVGSYHKKFYSVAEDIEIITLIPEQLNFLIYNKEFEEKLPEHLRTTKDM